jgi:pimeloyl-ACP methyl ester carboxylesterase
MIFLVQQQPAHVSIANNAFEADLPTWVFIHGAANDHRVWETILLDTADVRVNLLAIDLPGHGATFAAAKNTIEDYADWVINLLDNGAINSATLVGHSMGSLIALDCAKRYPTRVEKLVLIGTSAPMPVADKVLTMARDALDDAYDMIVRASFYVEKNADGTWPEPSDAMTKHRLRLSENKQNPLATDMQACHQYAIDTNVLAQIQTETLVIIGDKDRMTPPEASRAVAEAMPNARSVTIANAGHMMMWQAASQVRKALALE